MAILSLTRGAAPGAGAAVVTALIVLVALLAVPFHLTRDGEADAARPHLEDWRGNSASLDSLR